MQPGIPENLIFAKVRLTLDEAYEPTNRLTRRKVGNDVPKAVDTRICFT